MTDSSKDNIFQDILFLYELSLSIGKTLDFRKNCEEFLRIIMSRKNLDFSSIWLRSPESDNLFERFISIPEFKPSICQVNLNPKLMMHLRDNPHQALQLDFSSNELIDPKIGEGTYAYFALGNLAMLELFSLNAPEKLSESKLRQLEGVTQKLGNTLEGCNAYKSLQVEIKNRKEAEKQVKSIALFPEENPQPIFRISQFGKLLYANKASRVVLDRFGWDTGKTVPRKLYFKVLKHLKTREKEFELKLDGSYFAFHWVYIPENNYMNVYGKDITEKKVADLHLKESELKYRQLVEAANDIIYKVDTRGIIRYVNPTTLRVMKAREESDIVGKHFTEMIRMDYRKKVLNFYKGQLKDKKPSTYLKFPAVDLEGKEFWVGQTVQAIIDDGEVLGFTSIARDITENVQAVQQLQRSEEKYRGIIENMNLGLLEVDLKDNIKYANDSFCNITGYHLEEIVGKPATKLLLPPNYDRSFMVENNKQRHNGVSSVYEAEIQKKNKEVLYMMVSGAPLYDNSGNIQGSIGIHLDLTQRMKAEEALKESEGKLRAVINSSLDAIISIDHEGVVIEWNKQAEEIFGFEANEAIGQTLSELIIPHRYQDAHRRGMKHFLTTGQGPVLNKRIELESLKKCGDEFPIEISIAPIEVKGRHVFSAFVRDITLEKASKQEMEKALEKEKELNEMKSRFVSMTSHEFRTPLTTIQSNIELLSFQLESQEIKNREKIDKSFSRIHGEIHRLTHLLNDILLLGRIESGKIPFKPIETDLVQVIRELINQSFSSQEDGREVTLGISGTPKPVSMDEFIFSHVLSNLISNAFKYSPEKPSPEMSVSFLPENVIIDVKDHGIGIPDQEVPKLFDSFFRASNVDNIQGTGLGLSIVKQFVEMHQGNIQVTSKPNQGTTFSVSVPYSLNI